MVDSSKRRLNVVSSGRTLGVTVSGRLSLMGVTPATGPPMYGVVSCKGCYFRRAGHRGRTEGGRGAIRIGRIEVASGVSAGSFGAGTGRTVGFLGNNSGIGMSVELRFHGNITLRSRVDRGLLRRFGRLVTRCNMFSGPDGIRNEGVILFMSPGTSGWGLSGSEEVGIVTGVGMGARSKAGGHFGLANANGMGFRRTGGERHLVSGSRGTGELTEKATCTSDTGVRTVGTGVPCGWAADYGRAGVGLGVVKNGGCNSYGKHSSSSRRGGWSPRTHGKLLKDGRRTLRSNWKDHCRIQRLHVHE